MRFLGVQNVIDQPIYDTVQMPAAAGLSSLFLVPLNGALTAAAAKTYAHTNMTQAGRIEKGCELEIRALSMYIRPVASGGAAVTLADYRVFYNTGHVNVQIGQQSVFRLPTSHIPCGPCELQYFSNIAAAATEFQNNHGLGAFGNKYILENPVVLEENEAIQVDITVAALAAVTDVTFTLWGKYTRPVR